MRDDFLSPAERSLYGVLCAAVGEWATVCPKVSLDDVFYAQSGDHGANVGDRNRIARKHVDFLLCDPGSMRPVLGFELDDASHERAGRQTRDRFVDQVFAAAGLPLLRVPVQAAYDTRALAEAIERAKRHFLVSGVQYVEIGAAYEMSLFEDLEGYADSLIPIERSIYDHVIYDSKVERDFARALDGMDEVKLFVRLPGWFTVPTPIGEYNPDWAIVWQAQDAFGEEQEKLYLVRETKGSLDEVERRGRENLKIACARRHFGAIEVDYDDVTSAEEFQERLLRSRG